MPISLHFPDVMTSMTIATINKNKETSTTVATKKGNPADNSEIEKTKKACSEFESLFMYQLFKQMRATIPKTGLLGDDKSQEIYTEMMDMEVSKKLADSGGIGLAALMYRQLQEHNINGGDKIGPSDEQPIAAVPSKGPEKND